MNRILLVYGPAGVGKSRLVLHSLHSEEARTVVLGPPGPDFDALLRTVASEKHDLIVVVDAVPKACLSQVLDTCLAHRTLKAAVVAEEPINHAQVYPLEVRPLDYNQVMQLVEKVTHEASWERRDALVRIGGGHPGPTLIAAASPRDGEALEKGKAWEELRKQIAEQWFIERLRQQISADAFKAVRALSLLRYVITEPWANEISALSLVTGVPVDAFNEVLAKPPTGSLQCEEGYVAVMPPLLAERLAGEVLAARPDAVNVLALRLSRDGLRRLSERLAAVGDPSVERLAASFFSERIKSLDDLWRFEPIAKALAEAAPDRAVERLRTLVRNSFEDSNDPAKLSAIGILEALARWARTFSGAAHLLAQVHRSAPREIRREAENALLQLLHVYAIDSEASLEERLRFIQNLKEEPHLCSIPCAHGILSDPASIQTRKSRIL